MSPHKENPFPGLRSFNFEESHLFFGREQHIRDLLKKLNSNHFVAIVGTSGSGKSSLVRAGLLPAIQKQNTNSESWIITTMKPGNSPVKNMAGSLLSCKELASGAQSEDAEDLKKIESTLEASSLGLVQVVRRMIPPGKKLLILLDQFEETFRFSGTGMEVNDENSEKFVQLIIDAIRQRDVPVYVILTIRSDFLGDCARFEGLPEAINDGHYLVPRLNGEQNKLAITGPVNYADGKISPRLVQRLISDLGDNPDQLPVLQHALMRTWDKWIHASDPGEPMDLRHYEMTGTMSNALSIHADEAFEELKSQKQKDLVKNIFKAITVKSGESRGVRRPTSVQALSEITGAGINDVIEVLHPFRKHGRTFILPDEDAELNKNSIIDISHESLMRAWERLRHWVEEESESAALYERLCMSANLHKSGNAALWRDPELQSAIDWQERVKPNKAWASQYNNDFDLAMNFLEASQQERSSEQMVVKRRKMIVRSAVAIFLVVISSLTIWALFQTDKAQENYVVAQQKAQEAENQKELAQKSEQMALDASKKALDSKSYAELQSSIAQEQKILAEQQKQRAESEAQKARQQEQFALQQKVLAEQKSEEALTAKQKAEQSQNETNRLRMLGLSQNLAFKSLQVKNDPQLKALLAYEAYKLAKENGGDPDNQQLYAAAYDASAVIDPTFKEIRLRESAPIKAIHAGNSSVSTAGSNGSIQVYNVKDLSKSTAYKFNQSNDELNTAYFSHNGNYALAGHNDNSAELITVGKGSSVKLTGHSGLLRAVAFQTGGSSIATGARDSSVIVYNNGQKGNTFKFGSRIKALEFMPASNDLLVGCDDGQIFMLTSGSSSPVLFSKSPGSRLESMSVGKDGKMIAAGYSDGLIQVLGNTGAVMKRLNENASVDFIFVDNENGRIIAATARPLIRIYQTKDLSVKPVEITALNSPVTGMDVFDGDIYVSCKDRSVRKYPISTEYFRPILQENIKRDLTEEEWKTYVGGDVPYRSTTTRLNK